MSDVDISVKPVHELLLDASGAPIRYRIAAYQRGYRWTPQQVTQLLEDILEFTKRPDQKQTDWYCLQPLVLRPHESGAFEVVDGQQRLTTLLLVLRYFNARMIEEDRYTLYTLEYETRPDLPTFLENPADDRADDNVDFFHIANATKTIKAWFQARRTAADEMKPSFLTKAKVIWYVLPPTENAVDAFTRLNVGKVPLTSGELIRALFLRGAKATEAEETRTDIAYEWDLLEKGLQRDDFWLFLRNDRGKPGPRIGFLFELVARAEGMKGGGDDYAAFYYYSRKLADPTTDVRQVWLTIRQTYMLLDEWYEDRRLFHLVGFLVWAQIDLNTLLGLAVKSTKSEFQAKLHAMLFSNVVGSGDLAALSPQARSALINERLDDLEYGPTGGRFAPSYSCSTSLPCLRIRSQICVSSSTVSRRLIGTSSTYAPLRPISLAAAQDAPHGWNIALAIFSQRAARRHCSPKSGSSLSCPSHQRQKPPLRHSTGRLYRRFRRMTTGRTIASKTSCSWTQQRTRATRTRPSR
jgi:hypothetical protein